MIQANELRIGNWFFEFGIPTQADGTFIDRLQNIQFRNKVAIDVSPIPLTPEILEKCGFQNSSEEFIIFINKQTFIELDTNDYFYHVFIKQKDTTDKNIKDVVLLDIELEYLHQLQNLYFALTGEELKCNL